MTILELLNAANEGYPEKFLENYYDEKGNYRKMKWAGDTLAEFIVLEILDTYNDSATDEEQIGTAVHCLENAQTDLQAAIKGLRSNRK